MKCPKCQADNPDNATYCSHCGACLLPEEPKNTTTSQTYTSNNHNTDYFILIGIFGLILSILPIPFLHLVGLGLDIAGLALPQSMSNKTNKTLCIIGIVCFVVEALASIALFIAYWVTVGFPMHVWFNW
jgi:hypothetical protein